MVLGCRSNIRISSLINSCLERRAVLEVECVDNITEWLDNTPAREATTTTTVKSDCSESGEGVSGQLIGIKEWTATRVVTASGG